MQTYFHSNLAYLRKQKGYSQENMADELNITRSRLSSWEENRASPKMCVLADVAMHFNLTIDALVCQNLDPELVKIRQKRIAESKYNYNPQTRLSA